MEQDANTKGISKVKVYVVLKNIFPTEDRIFEDPSEGEILGVFSNLEKAKIFRMSNLRGQYPEESDISIWEFELDKEEWTSKMEGSPNGRFII